MGETDPTIKSSAPMPNDQFTPSPGDRIREYEILEMIGMGGMATVYKARHTLINQLVALKILKHSLTSDIQFSERFLREAQTQAQLTGHKNIVTIHNFIIERGLYIIIMEYVDGIGVSGQKIRTLAEQLRYFGAMDAWHLKPILEGVLAGLDFAHEQDIIHRDIKPSNIMFTNRGVAKIADFGIAQIIVEQRLTRTGAAIGTPKYMSPEQVRGKTLDARSDIYSLGITIYESLTGAAPFTGDTDYEIMRKHEEEEPKPPREINPRIPEAWEKMILKCIAKDPEQRPQNYKGVFQILETPSMAKKPPEKIPAETESREPVPDPAEPFDIVWEEKTKPVFLWILSGVTAVFLILLAGYYFLIVRNPANKILSDLKLPGHNSEKALLKQSLDEKFTGIGNLVTHLPYVEDAVITKDKNLLNDIISGLLQDEPEITYAHFTDNRNNVIASSDPQAVGEIYYPNTGVIDSDTIIEKNDKYDCCFNLWVGDKKVGSFYFGAIAEKGKKIRNEQDIQMGRLASIGNRIAHSVYVKDAVLMNEEWKLHEVILTIARDEPTMVYAHFVNKKNKIISSNESTNIGKVYKADLAIADTSAIQDENGNYECGFSIKVKDKKIGALYFSIRTGQPQ